MARKFPFQTHCNSVGKEGLFATANKLKNYKNINHEATVIEDTFLNFSSNPMLLANIVHFSSL